MKNMKGIIYICQALNIFFSGLSCGKSLEAYIKSQITLLADWNYFLRYSWIYTRIKQPLHCMCLCCWCTAIKNIFRKNSSTPTHYLLYNTISRDLVENKARNVKPTLPFFAFSFILVFVHSFKNKTVVVLYKKKLFII